MGYSEYLICIIFTFNGLFYNLKAVVLEAEGVFLRCQLPPTTESSIFFDFSQVVRNCGKKIKIVLTVKNQNKSGNSSQYIFMNDVVDKESNIKMKLLNPLLIKFRQEQVVLGYPIKHIAAVNARAAEVVINYLNNKNYVGCDDDSLVKPTCGFQYKYESALDYSQGFCCYCPPNMKGKQVRGGQNCSLSKSPSPNINLTAYKASAHCLVKNKLWYTVNALDEPIILHQTFIQIFNLKHLINGSSVWFALADGEEFTVGPHNPYQYDANKTVVMSYISEKPSRNTITIPYETHRLLIPQPDVSTPETDLPPAVKNGPKDYLVYPNNLIETEGFACDKAGVSYEGFALQSDRCKVPKKTCLKNQPFDFWDSDNKLRSQGKKGKYLLENFGVPHKDPIIKNKDTNELWLAMEYYKPYQSTIYIEVEADDISALTIGKHAIILTVISESTSKAIIFYVTIQNSGLASSEYSVVIKNCEFSVPNVPPASIVIAPQLSYNFVFKISATKIQVTQAFNCIVEVSSKLYKVVAQRQVIIKPLQRCVCNFHCSCVCLGESLTCVPLHVKDFHLAGFRGSLPLLIAKPKPKLWFVNYPFLGCLAFGTFLLLIGFIKASFGVMGVSSIGELGLRKVLYKPKLLKEYPEPELQDVEVVYDDDGYPLHPNTKQKFKLFSPGQLFVLNCFFCFVWPLIVCRRCLQWKRKGYKKKGYKNVINYDDRTYGEHDAIKYSISDDVDFQNEDSESKKLKRSKKRNIHLDELLPKSAELRRITMKENIR